MSNDYTPRKEDEAFALPPVPDPDVIDSSAKLYMHYKIERYGHACAEAARAPLLARIAELEAEIESDRKRTHGYSQGFVDSLRADRDRLRAEVEALRADVDTTIRVVWQAAITAANNICVQRSDRWNDEDGPCERIAESSECAKAIRGWIEPVAHMHELRELVDADIAARKGEGSEPPENCRQRLRAEGKAYPRSSCEACGQFSPKHAGCDALLEAKRAAQAKEGAE